MIYDFDTPVNRLHTDSLKWDVQPHELPMWVADMDFAAAPAIQRALADKVATSVYGYQIVPDRFAASVARWWRTRHGWEVDPHRVIFCTGIVPAVTTCVRTLTQEGDNVAVLSPVYDIFYHSIENMGRQVAECPLAYDGRTYSIDWAALESHLAHPRTTMMILCNPHNPTGQVWTADTLARIGELCHTYGVTVLSDEIHCDLTLPDVQYVPYGTTPRGNEAVVCVSASKAFNLAGLQGAAVIVPDEQLHRRVERALNACEVAEPNLLAVAGTVAALDESADWLDALRAYLAENRALVTAHLATQLPEVYVVPQQATYLMWLDVRAITPDSTPLCRHIRQSTGLWVTAGAQYRGNGGGFVRLNIACPRSVLIDGLTRFVKGVRSFRS